MKNGTVPLNVFSFASKFILRTSLYNETANKCKGPIQIIFCFLTYNIYHLQRQHELPLKIINLIRMFYIVKDIQSYLPIFFYLLFLLLLIVALHRARKIDEYKSKSCARKKLKSKNNSEIIKR